jgi:hypothetical protein
VWGQMCIVVAVVAERIEMGSIALVETLRAT